MRLASLAGVVDYALNLLLPMRSTIPRGAPAAADPAGSSPLPAGSPVPPEGVESLSRPAIPPSGDAAPLGLCALSTSELLTTTADALAMTAHTLRMLTGLDLDDTAPQVVTVTQWCAELRDRAAQFAAHGD